MNVRCRAMLRVSREPALDVFLQQHAAEGKPMELCRQKPLINLHVILATLSLSLNSRVWYFWPPNLNFSTILRSSVRVMLRLVGRRMLDWGAEAPLRLGRSFAGDAVESHRCSVFSR